MSNQYGPFNRSYLPLPVDVIAWLCSVVQVFGKLLGGDAESPEEDVSARPVGDEATSPERPETSNDLKEHMVGILFSRSKLTHLQKQVSCASDSQVMN